MKPGIDQVTELPLQSWLEQFRCNLEETGFYIRANFESLREDPPIRIYGDESPRITIKGMPGASLENVMKEVLSPLGLTYLVHADHLEVLKKEHVGKLPDPEPVYRPEPSPGESYKKAFSRLKAPMNPMLDRTIELPLSSWLTMFEDGLKGTGFVVRVNRTSLERPPAIRLTDMPRVRVQALPGATLEAVMTEVLSHLGLTFIVHADHIEVVKRADAGQGVYDGAFLGRTTEVGQYETVSPHPWGLCDMHGNVWQWCENWYDGERTNRALRGGAWNASPADCRTAHRLGAPPDKRSNDTGFRVCYRPD